jgi:hypothetical protein
MAIFTPTLFYFQPPAVAAAPPAGGIVTDGLIIYMDTTIAASYPGSGTSIYNLVAGQAYTGSLVNGVTYTGGYLQVAAASSQYININAPNYTSQVSTVMGATRYTDTTGNGRMIAAASNNWLLGHWSNTIDNYYAEGQIYGIPGTTNDTNWRIYTGTKTAGGQYGFYINASLVVSNASGNQGPNGLRIGGANNNTEYSDGQFCFIMLYNRALTQDEITQNYNALKSKVGLS